MLDSHGTHTTKRVEFDFVFAQYIESTHDVLVGIVALFVDAVHIVQVFRTINRDAY